MAPCPHREGAVPEALGGGAQAPVEAALGEGLEVAAPDQKGQGVLLAARRGLGGDKGNGHDSCGRVEGLLVILVPERSEAFFEGAVDRDNLVLRGRLLAERVSATSRYRGGLPALQGEQLGL
jgi:hypothetical protein